MAKKNIFLFDGVGAALSAILHALILPIFSSIIGLPVSVHYLLAVFPLIYLLNSFFCYFKVNHDKPIWLQIVISGNILYCIITGLLLIKYWDQLKSFGVTYFALEYLVMFIVIFTELNVLSNIKKK